MTAIDVKPLRTAAEEAARRSGRILAERFHQERTIDYKGGIDLVTDADRASEEALLQFIRSEFPGHAVLAEESGAHEGSDIRWIVDPLDGTTNYAHRVPHFCVSIAVEHRGELLVGVVYDPIRDELFSGARGQGATCNGVPLQMRTVSRLGDALLATGFPYDVQEFPEGPVSLFSHFIVRSRGIRRMGSAALDLAYVAAGRFDGFFEFGLKPWDIAGGALLVREAGGSVTNLDGSALALIPGDVLAASRELAGALIAECQPFLDAPSAAGR